MTQPRITLSDEMVRRACESLNAGNMYLVSSNSQACAIRAALTAALGEHLERRRGERRRQPRFSGSTVVHGPAPRNARSTDFLSPAVDSGLHHPDKASPAVETGEGGVEFAPNEERLESAVEAAATYICDDSDCRGVCCHRELNGKVCPFKVRARDALIAANIDLARNTEVRDYRLRYLAIAEDFACKRAPTPKGIDTANTGTGQAGPKRPEGAASEIHVTLAMIAAGSDAYLTAIANDASFKGKYAAIYRAMESKRREEQGE